MKKFLMVLLSIAFVLNLAIVIGLIGGYVRHAGRFTPSQTS
mgnify:FL=1